MKNSRYYPLFLLFLSAFIWGGSFILIKRGLDSFTPGEVGALRIFFAFSFMLPHALLNIKKIPRNKLLTLFISGFVGNFIPAFLFAIAETKMTSALAGILNALTPIFALIIGVFIFKNKMTWIQVSGIILGFIGTAGLSFVTNAGDLGSFNYYVLYLVAATICYGFNVHQIRRFLHNIKGFTITAMAMFFTGPLAILYLIFDKFDIVKAVSPESIHSLIAVAILGILNTAIALAIMNKVIKLTSAEYGSSVTYIIPIAALLIGVFNDEPIYIWHFAGMALIIVGVLMINRKMKKLK